MGRPDDWSVGASGYCVDSVAHWKGSLPSGKNIGSRAAEANMKLLGVLLLAVLVLGPPTSSAADVENGHPALRMINSTRAEHGLPPLQWDSRLAAVATNHSIRMSEGFGYRHSPDGGNDMVRAGIQGTLWGENCDLLQAPYASKLSESHKRFLESPAHFQNILDDWDIVGVGVVRDEYRGLLYVTYQFVRVD